MNTLIKALRQIIEANGEISSCCVTNGGRNCEFRCMSHYFNDDYACEVFNVCINEYNVPSDDLMLPSKAKYHMEQVLNQIVSELITE